MKKILSVILSFVLCLEMFSGVSYAFAMDEEKISGNNLFVITKSCPDEYIDYVKENVQDFLLSIPTSELPAGRFITVGTPFSFANADSDIFYFPILFDDEINYLLRVYPKESGGYGGILGKTFVEELKKFATLTSSSTPVAIMMEGDTVVSYISDERYVMMEYPIGSVGCENAISIQSITSNSLEVRSQYEIVNIYRQDFEIDYSKSTEALRNISLVSFNSTERDSSIPTYKYLATSITERQGSEPWCAAYATAMIVRFVKGGNDNTSALNVMNFHFNYNPSVTDTIGEEEVVEYANARILYPTHVTYTLSYATLLEEIVEDRPVYMRLYRIVGTDKTYHAVVLQGYNIATSKWQIWNPWYNHYETFDIGGTYVPSTNSSREYIYCETIYNW